MKSIKEGMVIRALIGIIMFFSGLWGGFYFVVKLGMLHWTSVPIVMTGILLCAGGFIIGGYAIMELIEEAGG